jgi:hypothetical protein
MGKNGRFASKREMALIKKFKYHKHTYLDTEQKKNPINKHSKFIVFE